MQPNPPSTPLPTTTSSNKRARVGEDEGEDRGGRNTGGDTDDIAKKLTAITSEEGDVKVSTNGNTNHNQHIIILEPIRTDVSLIQSQIYAKLYREARPYPHGIIRNFCKEGILGEFLVIYCDC